MKKKVKKFQEGGILRDRYGNPVRSGSGDVVRTRYPDRSYDEQASASMTESSDYSGRRQRTPDEDMSSSYMPSSRIGASDIGYGGGEDEEPRRTITSRKLSDEGSAGPAEEKVVEKTETVTRKPVKKMVPRAKATDKVGAGYESLAKKAEAPKSKFSDTGKSVRLNALLKSIPGNPFGMKKGGTVSSASKRADGIAQRGKTRGKIC